MVFFLVPFLIQADSLRETLDSAPACLILPCYYRFHLREESNRRRSKRDFYRSIHPSIIAREREKWQTSQSISSKANHAFRNSQPRNATISNSSLIFPPANSSEPSKSNSRSLIKPNSSSSMLLISPLRTPPSDSPLCNLTRHVLIRRNRKRFQPFFRIFVFLMILWFVVVTGSPAIGGFTDEGR